MRMRPRFAVIVGGALVFGALWAISLGADDSGRLLSIDHYVPVHSTVPAIAGQIAEIYLRERVEAGLALRTSSLTGRVALFIHGAGTPAEVAFDAPYQDYSWMAYLARAGFDVFSMDTTGYGRSTRPPEMNDPCNLSAAQQKSLVPGFLRAPCPPSYPHQMTTIASDWNDIDAAVDFIRAHRQVDKISLLGWSLGGPRAGGYAAQHPEKVDKLVLLAPAYLSTWPSTAPEQLPADGATMSVMDHERFLAAWTEQVGCADEYDPQAAESVWSEMVASDPVAATWGTGMRRAPNVTVWGWHADMVAKIEMPTLLVSGQYDKSIPQDRVRALYGDLPGHHKVFVDLACSCHNAIWERNHSLLFRASLEWLTTATIDGQPEGMLRMGYSQAERSQAQEPSK